MGMKEQTPEIWKDIPGYGGKYQASVHGNIRRVYASGKTRQLTPWHRKMRGSPRLVVKLTHEGKSREVVVLGLVALTFIGPRPEGYVPYHINGMQSDNSARNIAYISRKELGRLTGPGARRKPVAKIDASGNVVEYYSSAREAGRKNHMSYQAILDRCNGKIKSPFALDGYNYLWD